MANFGKYRFYIAFGCLLTLLAIKLNAQSQVVPALSSWKSAKGSLVLKPDFVIAVSQKDVKIIGLELDNFVKDLKRNTKLSPKVVIATTPKAGDIHFELSDDKNTLSQEAYELNINQLVYIKAKSAHGIFYATQTLLQVLKQTGNRLEMGLAIDGPTFESRGIMIDVGRKYFSMSYLKQVIRQLGWYKMNTLHLHFTEWSAFRLKSDKYPGL